MESDPRLPLIAAHLQATLDPGMRAAAEHELRSIERSPGFTSLLLTLSCGATENHDIRFAAAVLFKNFVRRHWEQNTSIPDPERASIRHALVTMLAITEPKIRLQMSDAITLVAAHDFPNQWPTLVEELVAKLSPNDFTVNNVVLQTAYDIFKRWRGQFRSNDLYSEILMVVGVFCEPFQQIFRVTDSRLKAILHQGTDKPSADLYVQTMCLLTKIFHILNLHDIPEFFEDRIEIFFPVFLHYLKLSHSFWHLESADDETEDEPTPLEFLKTAIYHVSSLYTESYTDVWGSYMSMFIEAVCQQLANAPKGAHADQMVSCAMALLTVAVQRTSISKTIAEDTDLELILKNIVLPNLALRPSDEDLLESEPHAFVRRDVSCSDQGPRRNAASGLLKALLVHFESSVLSNCAIILDSMLLSGKEYEYRVKDCAVALFIAVSSKDHVTSSGILNLTCGLQSQDGQRIHAPVEFFKKFLITDLLPNSGSPPHKLSIINALRFIIIFRHHLDPATHLLPLLSTIANLLQSNEVAVYLSAAIALDRVLSIFDRDKIPSETVGSVAEYVTAFLQRAATTTTVQENDALLRILLRCIRLGHANVNSVFSVCVLLLDKTCSHSTNPLFTHYVFECIALTIQMQCEIPVTARAAIAHCESCILPILTQILAADITDFIPYAFQLFSQMLRINPASGQHETLPAKYGELLEQAMHPNMWVHSGNVPGIVLFMQAYLNRAGPCLASQPGKLGHLLGVFQRLLSTRTHEALALEFLVSMLSGVPETAMQQYTVPLLTELLKRLSNHPAAGGELRRTRITAGIVALLGFWFASVQDACSLVTAFESIQPGVLASLVQQVVAPSLEKVTVHAARRAAVLGWTRFAACGGSRVCPDEDLALLLAALAKTIEKMPENTQAYADAEENVDVEDRIAQSSYSRLTAIPRCIVDPMPTVPDSKAYFSRVFNVLTGSRREAASQATKFMGPELVTRFR